MTLSFNKLNEIAELYESIAASEQEQLDELGPSGSALDYLSRGFKSAPGPVAVLRRQPNGGMSQGTAYKSSSDNKMYANYNDAKAARDSRLKSLAAKQQASRGDSGGNGSGGNTRPPANPKVAPTKPTGSAMDQWAKANPKLAAAKAERDRTRGTSATTNPLMKDMKSSLPAPAPKSAPPSSTLKSATDSASKPSAFKPATTAVASSTTDKGVVPASNAIAAAPKPKPMVPTRMPLAQSFEYDAYDLVLEYLLSQGHAENVAEAQYLMTEMDAEMIGDIVEEALSEDANYDRNRKRAAQRAAARNAARDAGKTGAVPGVGYVTPRRESETYRDSTGTERHKSGARMPEKKG